MPWLDLWFIKQNLSNLVVRLNLTWHAIIAFAHDVDVSKVLSLVRSQFHQTFYEQICIQKRICVIFWQKYIGTKGTHKILWNWLQAVLFCSLECLVSAFKAYHCFESKIDFVKMLTGNSIQMESSHDSPSRRLHLACRIVSQEVKKYILTAHEKIKD